MKKLTVAKVNYIIYCRKSSESEDRQIQSLEDQEKALKELAAAKGLSVVKVFTEKKSAKAPGRPVFGSVLELLHQSEDIKGIIAWSVSRLTRNPVDTGTLQWLLQTGSIEEIVTPTKTYTEVDSDFIMAVEGAQANRFIRDLKRDTERGIQSKIDKGLAPILAPPGYSNNIYKKQGEKDIIPHPEYFTLMRKVFDLALSGNFSIDALAEKSQDIGVKNSRGKPISRTQMAKILHNPFYTGKFIYGQQLYPGVHQPMLTEAEFDLIQDIISGRSRPRKQKHDFPLSGGLIKCVCGRSLTAELKVKNYKKL